VTTKEELAIAQQSLIEVMLIIICTFCGVCQLDKVLLGLL